MRELIEPSRPGISLKGLWGHGGGVSPKLGPIMAFWPNLLLWGPLEELHYPSLARSKRGRCRAAKPQL